MLLEKKNPLKYIMKKIGVDFLVSIVFICLVVIIEQLLHYDLTLSIAIPVFLGTAISLVLAFKLNQSYDRWWEARKIWGAIVNDSRSLVVQLKSFAPKEDLVVVRKIAYRQITWCYELASKLRQTDQHDKLNEYLASEEKEAVLKNQHIPLMLIDLNASDISKLKQKQAITDFQQIQIDDTMVRLCASMGKAERIKNTVFPKTYRMFLKLFIYTFILSLIISLSDHLNWVLESAIILTIITPFLLLEKTALHIQDPFENKPSDTAMTAISQTIEANIRELLGENVLETKQEDHGFYVL